MQRVLTIIRIYLSIAALMHFTPPPSPDPRTSHGILPSSTMSANITPVARYATPFSYMCSNNCEHKLVKSSVDDEWPRELALRAAMGKIYSPQISSKILAFSLWRLNFIKADSMLRKSCPLQALY